MKILMKRKHKKYMIDFLIFFSILFSLFSPLMVYRYSAVLSVALLFLWFLLTLINKSKWSVHETIAGYIYCYIVIVPYVAGYGFVANRYMAFATFILGCLISDYCDKTNRWDSIGFVLKMALPFLAFMYIRTFQALLENPWSVRLLTNYEDYANMLRLRGVGGYEFIYFLALLVSVSTGMFLLLNDLKEKGFFFLVSILSFIMIVLSNYMTALLIATVGVILTVAVFLMKRNKAWMIFFAFGIIAVVLFGNVLISIMLDILLKFIPNSGKTYMRLYSIKDCFFQELALLFLKERSYTIIKSIVCTLEHPLLGVVGRPGLSREKLLSNIGLHSYFFDTFAFYGGFIGVLSILNYFFIFRKKFFEGNLCVITVPMLASCLILLLFNNITPSVGLALGIVYPYVMYLLKIQSEDDFRISEDKRRK